MAIKEKMMDDYTTDTTEGYMGSDDEGSEELSYPSSYRGSQSLHGRVLKLESTTKRLQSIQYLNLGATAICIGGLFMGARVVAKLIASTNKIVQALDQAATMAVPPPMQAPPRRTQEDITAMRDNIGANSAHERSTTGHDPGPQEVSEEVRRSLERDSNLDALFNSDDI